MMLNVYKNADEGNRN